MFTINIKFSCYTFIVNTMKGEPIFLDKAFFKYKALIYINKTMCILNYIDQYTISILMYPVFEGHLFFLRILIFARAFNISRAEYGANARFIEKIFVGLRSAAF